MKIPYPPGATPLNDLEGLIPTYVTTKKELDELEFSNINRVFKKYFLNKLTEKKATFKLQWLLKVHREMFNEVWEWAGKPRLPIRGSGINLGVSPTQILPLLQQLTGNLRAWENNPAITSLEIATRLHHELVRIHPFKGGNGRWARMISNIYLRKNNQPLIQWPEDTMREDSLFRKTYISALQKADEGNFDSLIELHRQYREKEI